MIDRPTEKQINMLVYALKSNWPDIIPSHMVEGKAGQEDHRWYVLRDWAATELDKYKISGLINILEDEDFSDEWRRDFLQDYLGAKKHPDFV